MKRTGLILAMLLALAGAAPRVIAQDDSVPPPAPYAQTLDGSQLDQLLGPIALYPDPLIAQILPAATQPSQVAVAYNYISQGGDPNAIDQQPWDSSVKALAHYPDVLKMMDDDLSWTAELGQAFLNQPTDVMDSVQRLRVEAQNMGNLQDSPEESIVSDDGDIDIVPTNPEMIYVPVYDPGIIYFQRPYGRRFLSFGVGFRIGGWLDHDFDWHRHDVVVWGHDHPRPANWWHEPPAQRRTEISRGNPWRPPAGVEHRQPVVRNRGDRGYEPHPAPPRETRPTPPRPNPGRPNEPAREVRPAPEHNPVEQRPAPVRPEAPVPSPREVRPAPIPAPVPAPRPVQPPVQVHNIPSRPASAFTSPPGQSARQAQAASSRGAASRQSGGAPERKH